MTTVANILTAVSYRIFPDTSQSITTTSEPSSTECIQWINEVCAELLTVCIETKTEIGRAMGTVTLSDGDSDYPEYQNLIFSPTVMYDQDGEQFSGWIEKTNVRNPLTLTTESAVINYDPALESEPVEFYLDGSNNLIFLPTPDDTYTAKIPYYPYHTTLTATTETVPFKQIFDNVIIESVTMRAQNRDEYDLSFELKWFSYIRGQARKIISMRKNETVRFMH
jgi:hypothetical protein